MTIGDLPSDTELGPARANSRPDGLPRRAVGGKGDDLGELDGRGWLRVMVSITLETRSTNWEVPVGAIRGNPEQVIIIIGWDGKFGGRRWQEGPGRPCV